jgi:hypothetical protein
MQVAKAKVTSKKVSKRQEQEEVAAKSKTITKKKAQKEKVEEPKEKEVKPKEEVKEEPPVIQPQIEETTKSIGVESINIIIDTLESVSIQDILSNENPDISTVSNNLLAIS